MGLEIVANAETPKVKASATKVEVKKDDAGFESLFDELITKNYITKDIVLSDKMTLTIKPLNSAELLQAETIYIATQHDIPQDVIQRVRTVSTLAYAIEAINGKEIKRGSDDEPDVRGKLHSKLMELPPALVDVITNAYRDLVVQQNGMLDEVTTTLQNF